MSCICINDYDGDVAEFIDVSHPRARKSHKCYECREAIHPGEEYEKVTGKWNGEFDTYKTCAICREVRDVVFTCGYSYGSIWNDVDEFRDEITIGALDQLGLVARQRLCERMGIWE